MQVALGALLLQQHDGIRDQLTGPVIRDVATALDLDDLDVTGGKHVLLRVAPATEREHVRMLDDDERVGRLTDLTGLDERELACPDIAVARGAEIEDLPRRGHEATVAGEGGRHYLHH